MSLFIRVSRVRLLAGTIGFGMVMAAMPASGQEAPDDDVSNPPLLKAPAEPPRPLLALAVGATPAAVPEAARERDRGGIAERTADRFSILRTEDDPCPGTTRAQAKREVWGFRVAHVALPAGGQFEVENIEIGEVETVGALHDRHSINPGSGPESARLGDHPQGTLGSMRSVLAYGPSGHSGELCRLVERLKISR